MFRTLLLSPVLGLMILAVAAADDPPKPDVKTEEPASIEVYRLKNADLNDAQQAFNVLVSRTRRMIGPRGDPSSTVLRAKKGFGPVTDPTSPFEGASPSGSHVGVGRGLADPRTRSLIVRGTAKDQQIAADLVAVLDTPEGKPLPAVKAIKAFRLQHLDANDLVNILLTLDPNMSYRLAPVGRMKLLVATGTDEQMKELADAVKKLDIPGEMK